MPVRSTVRAAARSPASWSSTPTTSATGSSRSPTRGAASRRCPACSRSVARPRRARAPRRRASAMRWPVLREALGLPRAEDARPAWPQVLAAARAIDIELPRAALRWYVRHYATPTARLDELREDRVLTVPELETVAHVDGTQTVQVLVKRGPLDQVRSVRLLWALVS